MTYLISSRLLGRFFGSHSLPKPSIYCQTRSVVTITKKIYYKCHVCGDYTNSPTHICTHCSKKKIEDETNDNFEDIVLKVYLNSEIYTPTRHKTRFNGNNNSNYIDSCDDSDD